MPCFKGLAVSIHSNDGPLAEHGIQRQSRFSRITTYIPVPPPKVSPTSDTLEQSNFAISITLLTPGLTVPYSTPKATKDDPFPPSQIVGALSDFNRNSDHKGSLAAAIAPYQPLTSSPNETVAAYIYFDGRQKEEVATLLRRGEETWVNSRWVGVPELEGGGLAEREFLFREVGLERWLNGLDLQGKDTAAVVERRRRRMEKKRRKRRGTATSPYGSDDEGSGPRLISVKPKYKGGVLKYGADESAPLEKLSDDEDMSSSEDEDDDDDDDPLPESTGQIKVALFRVLASGEIKKGEYSPQFDAHDDDEDAGKNTDDGEDSIDHTTSFAKPKSLDPRTISTQTVTGIDGPDKPYAVFTFLYRGDKQLQKMGILKTKKPATTPSSTAATKRRSVPTDFANLKPLKPGGARGFTGLRDGNPSPHNRNGTLSPDDDMSDDEEREEKFVDADDGNDGKDEHLSPEEARKRGELADGVRKIRLKRQHSFEPPPSSTAPTLGPAPPASARLPSSTPPVDGDSPPQLLSNATYDPSAGGKAPLLTFGGNGAKLDDPAMIGSPLKKQRASTGEGFSRASAEALAKGLGFGFAGPADGDAGTGGVGPVTFGGPLEKKVKEEKEAVGLGLSAAVKKEDEEL